MPFDNLVIEKGFSSQQTTTKELVMTTNNETFSNRVKAYDKVVDTRIEDWLNKNLSAEAAAIFRSFNAWCNRWGFYICGTMVALCVGLFVAWVMLKP